jgi:hypothetical protein
MKQGTMALSGEIQERIGRSIRWSRPRCFSHGRAFRPPCCILRGAGCRSLAHFPGDGTLAHMPMLPVRPKTAPGKSSAFSVRMFFGSAGIASKIVEYPKKRWCTRRLIHSDVEYLLSQERKAPNSARASMWYEAAELQLGSLEKQLKHVQNMVAQLGLNTRVIGASKTSPVHRSVRSILKENIEE